MMGTTKLSQFESQFSRYLKAVYAGTVDYPILYQNYQRFYPGVPDIAGVTRILQPDDSRKVIQIPESAIIYGDLQPNERKNISEPEAHLVIRN